MSILRKMNELTNNVTIHMRRSRRFWLQIFFWICFWCTTQLLYTCVQIYFVNFWKFLRKYMTTLPIVLFGFVFWMHEFSVLGQYWQNFGVCFFPDFVIRVKWNGIILFWLDDKNNDGIEFHMKIWLRFDY